MNILRIVLLIFLLPFIALASGDNRLVTKNVKLFLAADSKDSLKSPLKKIENKLKISPKFKEIEVGETDSPGPLTICI
ncbi:MAG: hypothetical protein KAG61_01940 [Bacteriovoracaceae bacterium]|nr:hypothetical protein [Bacteriovoracaceae bacterium]